MWGLLPLHLHFGEQWHMWLSDCRLDGGIFLLLEDGGTFVIVYGCNFSRRSQLSCRATWSLSTYEHPPDVTVLR